MAGLFRRRNKDASKLETSVDLKHTDPNLSTSPSSHTSNDHDAMDDPAVESESRNDTNVKEESAVPPTPTKKKNPIVISSKSDGIKPSDVKSSKAGEGYLKKRAKAVPTAADSAFAGPVRYDWVDVESSAAIKIQSIFRRNEVLEQMEREGKSTAAMRNRKRAQKVKGKKIMPSEDVPTVFRFCGLGFLFGDATGEDPEAYMERKKMEEKAKRQEKLDMDMEKRKFRMRKKASVKTEEAVEVVDDV